MRRVRLRSPSGSDHILLDKREVDALLDASRAAGEPIDLPSALRSILNAALTLLEADEGSIQLLEPASKTLWIAAARGIPDDIVRTSRVPLGEGVSGRVAATGFPALLASAVDIEKFQGYTPKERRIHGAICVPLRARGAVIGVLSINLMSPGPGFTNRDLDLARLFADNASHAIMGRQLLDRAQKQAVEVDTLRTASASLTSTLELEELADAILDRAAELAGTPLALLCVAGPGGTPVTLARYRGFSREAVRTTLASSQFQETYLAAVEPGLVHLPLAETPLAPLAAEVGDAEVLVLPALPDEDENTGVLIVQVERPVDVKLRLLRAFAPEASLALANALLHRKVATKEQELDTIVSSVPLPIVLVDSGRFRTLNPAAAEVFRLPQEFEAGQSIRGKLTPELEEMLLSRDEVMAREVVVRVAGMPKAFRASVTSVRLRTGATGRVLVLYDVTAQRELEQRKADFLAVIGHELRTPLTAIRGFTSTVIRNGDQLDAKMRTEALQRVLAQAHRLERLIEDLLFVSRMEESRPPLHRAWDDAVAVCQEVVEEFRRREPGRHILFETPLPEIPVKMDRVKVEQVLYHLLDNALKYSEPSTPVRVTLSQEPNDLEISVADRGIGIYSGDIPRLFRAFGQLDSSATRKHGGTGVGLHVCKSLIDAFGGRIWADSMLGKGSTFSFTIPRIASNDD